MEKTKDQVARELARAHADLEQAVRKIIRIVSIDRENRPDEPIKLLEINIDTVPVGIMPIAFTPSEDVPYASIVIEITPSEFNQLQKQKLKLPEAWQISDVLIDRGQ